MRSNLSTTVEFLVKFDVSKILLSNNIESVKVDWSFGGILELIIIPVCSVGFSDNSNFQGVEALVFKGVFGFFGSWVSADVFFLFSKVLFLFSSIISASFGLFLAWLQVTVFLSNYLSYFLQTFALKNLTIRNKILIIFTS